MSHQHKLMMLYLQRSFVHLLSVNVAQLSMPQSYNPHRTFNTQNMTNYDKCDLMCHVITAFKVECFLGLPPKPPPSSRPMSMSHSSEEVEWCEYFSLHPCFYSPITDYFIFEAVVSLLFCHMLPQVNPKMKIIRYDKQDPYKGRIFVHALSFTVDYYYYYY